MARRFLQSLACVALLLPLSAQSATVHHGNLTRSNSAIVARIESLRSVYHLGDPIWLRLTLTNKSTDKVEVPGAPAPYVLVDLRVLDSRGRPLQHGASHNWFVLRLNSVRQVWTLSPGKPVVISVYDSDNHWQRSDWANIKSWGYRIGTPGSYTLIATPKIEWFGAGIAQGGESNKIRITETRGAAGGVTAATIHSTCATRNATATDAVRATYPKAARNLGLGSATVEIEVTVGAQGNLVDAQVVKSSGNPWIDEAALRAAQESSYSPKLVNCNATQGKYLFRAKVQPQY